MALIPFPQAAPQPPPQAGKEEEAGPPAEEGLPAGEGLIDDKAGLTDDEAGLPAEAVRTLPLTDEDGRTLARIPVSDAVYRSYWQLTEHEHYLDRRRRLRECSVDARPDMAAEDCFAYLGCQTPAAADDPPPIAHLRQALADEDPALVDALYALACGETTQTALAQAWGQTPSAVNKRIRRAHHRLRTRIEALENAA